MKFKVDDILISKVNYSETDLNNVSFAVLYKNDKYKINYVYNYVDYVYVNTISNNFIFDLYNKDDQYYIYNYFYKPEELRQLKLQSINI